MEDAVPRRKTELGGRFRLDFGDWGRGSNEETRSNALRVRSVVDNRGRIRIVDMTDGFDALEPNKDKYIKWISPRDLRYQEATRRLRHVENSLGANYLNYVRRGLTVQRWNLRRIGRAFSKSWLARLLVFGGSLAVALKDKTSEATIKAIEEASGGVVAGCGYGSGDQPPLEVYLDTLKEGVERLSPTDPGFSRSRPHLRSELNDAYQAISNDSDLGKEEKARLLGKVREIQIAIPAPQLRPSPSPNRRRGGGRAN